MGSYGVLEGEIKRRRNPLTQVKSKNKMQKRANFLHSCCCPGRSKTKTVLQAPLRGAMGLEERTRIKVNFSLGDVDNWKQTAKDYRNDPIGVAKKFEILVKSQDPDWKDRDVILDALTETEKQLVIKTACTQVNAQITAGTLEGRVEDYIPLTAPDWDYNDAGDYASLKTYQNCIKYGLENAIPKAVNWLVPFEIRQGPKESPTEFLDKLREAMRKYTTMDPSSEEGKLQLANSFVGQSSEDIRQKLQKLSATEIRDMEKLLEAAWKVFRNREQVKERKLGKVLTTATVAALGQVNEGYSGMRGRGRGWGMGMRGRSGGYGRTSLSLEQCANYKKFGHWKRECPQRQQQTQLTTEWELD